jgi:hypothetical protein
MRKKIFFMAIIFVFSTIFSFSYGAIDQTYVERILKENSDFIAFIDYGVTNFAPDKKEELFNIYQKHFNGEIAYLQGDYKRAFDSVYDSQKDMVALYEKILTDYYLEDSKNILDNIAPEIIKSKDAAARQYLTLGYRDRTLARTHYTVGEASHPKLYSYKLYKYVDAINMARRAKRYGFIAIYTGQPHAIKFKIYNQLFKSENENGSLFFKRFVDKNEQDFIKELDKTYEDYEKEFSAEGNQAANASTDKSQQEKVIKEIPFEGKVERSVRFRKEQRVARYLLNGEFDKAEPIIRSYVDNYNFKLITATLKTLSSLDHTGEEARQRLNYESLLKHHNDNYMLFNGKSMLESVQGDAKVIDSLSSAKKNNVVEDDVKTIETQGEKKEDKPAENSSVNK